MRPAAEARVIGPAGQVGQRVYALIDSGSDYTLAAPWMAMEVGIDINDGRETRVQVGGRPRPIRVLEATLQLCAPVIPESHEYDEENSLTWTAEVGFFESWEAPPVVAHPGTDRVLRSLHRDTESFRPSRCSRTSGPVPSALRRHPSRPDHESAGSAPVLRIRQAVGSNPTSPQNQAAGTLWATVAAVRWASSLRLMRCRALSTALVCRPSRSLISW
jgi:hypothetical protein